MNILILINSAPNYKYFFYELAKEIERNGHKIYFAVDSHRSKYLEPLPELDNHPNTFFFDDYFEKKFNINLDSLTIDNQGYWGDYFYSDYDRFLTHNFNLDKEKKYWLNVKIHLDSFFENIFKENNIDYVLYENISNSFAYAAYLQCEKQGKKYIGLMGSRLPGHFEIQNSIIEEEVEKITKLTKLPLTQEEVEWFENYKKSIVDIQPDYMKQNGLDSVTPLRLMKFSKCIKALRIVSMGFKYKYYYDYQFGNPFIMPMKALRINFGRYINTKVSAKFYTPNDVLEKCVFNEKFYVYPIHYHPESSTSVLAPEYTNEYANIVNISNNLPFGIYLYVKDHKSAKGIQNREFYKKISSLPNVRLVSYDINIKKLILKSLGVITVNSTAGYEALLLDKSVYIFGRVFYENFPNVYKLKTFRDIRDIREQNFQVKDLKEYFIAYKRYCYSGILFDKTSVAKVCDAIMVSVQ